MTSEEAAHAAYALYLRIFTKSTMAEIVEVIAEALLEAAKPKWRPIADAPKDHPILVVDAEMVCSMEVVEWDDDHASACKWATSEGPNFHEDFFTHWMPLPEPPEPIDKPEAP